MGQSMLSQTIMLLQFSMDFCFFLSVSFVSVFHLMAKFSKEKHQSCWLVKLFCLMVHLRTMIWISRKVAILP